MREDKNDCDDQGQSHTSESANHSASCSIAYDSYAPANWREHIRECLKTLSQSCSTRAKNHIGTIPVPRPLGGEGHKSPLPGTGAHADGRLLSQCRQLSKGGAMTPSVLSFRQMKCMSIAPGLMCRASLIRMCAPSRSVNSGELRCDVRPQARRDVRPDFNWNRKQVSVMGYR